MKKILLLIGLLLTAVQPFFAQDPLITHEEGETLLERFTSDGKAILSSDMNLQFYTSGAATFTEGELEEVAFRINKVRLEILGSFGKNFSYHFRQSFNKYSTPHALDNLSSSVEYAYVDWKLSDRLKLTVGKQIVQLGGHEYWINGLKIREFSEFNDNIACFQAGVNAAINLSPTQLLNLQVVNNRAGTEEDVFLYGRPEGLEKAKAPLLSTVNYDGSFYENALNLRYSVSMGQLTKGRNILYLTAGNIWEKGPIFTYFDVMYSREGVDSKGMLSRLSANSAEGGVTAQYVDYLTLIGNFDYRVHPQWNLYVKSAYEMGNIYKANGPYEKGGYRRIWNVQACAEFFPMKNSELLLFLHLLYKHHGFTERATRLFGAENYNTQRISLGLVYTIPVF